jgi:solute carrier family 15 (oligopeptide transporter), member 1
LLATIVGSGSLKSNLNAFAGNQFKLPEQSEQLSHYFSMQYFALKCGSTIARASFPILREDVKCFGMDDCYPLAFSLPAAGMLLAGLIVLAGSKSYYKEKPSGNMLLKVIGCVMVEAV